jgi:branched-chain amino acid transport system substrate-binding protein
MTYATRGQLTALVAATVGALALTACGNAADSSAGSSNGEKTIKIGFSAPLSGDQAYFGKNLLTGVKYAADQFKFTGALAGSKVEVVALDDGADPAQGVTVAKKFVAQNVDAVVAHFNSGVTLAAQPIYSAANIPEFTASSSPQVTERGFSNVVQATANDVVQGTRMAEFAKNRLGLAKVAIFNDSQTFGAGVAEQFQKSSGKLSLDIMSNTALSPTSQDFRSALGSVLRQHPDGIYFGGTVTTAGLLCNQARSLGFQGPFMGPDGILDPKMIKGCGNQSGKIYASFQYPGQESDPKLAKFGDDYKKATGEDQGVYGLQGFIQMDYLLTAINKAGTTDKQKVMDAVHSMTYESLLGPQKVDKSGAQEHGSLYIYKAEGGAFSFVE